MIYIFIYILLGLPVAYYVERSAECLAEFDGFCAPWERVFLNTFLWPVTIYHVLSDQRRKEELFKKFRVWANFFGGGA